MDKNIENIIIANSKVQWPYKIITTGFDKLGFRFNKSQPYTHLETYLLRNLKQVHYYEIKNKEGAFKEFPDFYLDLKVEYGVVLHNHKLFAVTRKIEGYNGMRSLVSKEDLDQPIDLLDFVNNKMKQPSNIMHISVSPKNMVSFLVYVEQNLELDNL